VFGGESGTTYHSATDVYDFADNRWFTLDGSFNMTSGRSRMGSATLGGFTYVTGGTAGTAVRTAERIKSDGFMILSTNQPPLVVVPATQQIALPGRELAFVVSAQDLESTVPVSITADGLPSGATFNVANETNNSAKGTFRWTPAAADVGRNITVTFTASDGSLTDVKIVQVSVIQASPLTAVNAADFKVAPMAVDSIAAAFGVNLAPRIEVAQTIPLPLSLADTMLTVNGIAAPLFFVSPTQINFVVPAGIDSGSATIIVSNPQGNYALGNIQIVAAAPAIFTANASGTGDAAAQATIDGVNFQQPPFDVVVNGRSNILVLYATGVRHVPATNPNDGNGVAESVTVTIDGKPANVLYAGPQGSFAGLDQINVEFPTTLAGQGARRVEVVVTVGGVVANKVTIQIK
ncbi:MAG: putative Ig domain-containing protein, partial [Blastocatellia bacterium]